MLFVIPSQFWPILVPRKVIVIIITQSGLVITDSLSTDVAFLLFCSNTEFSSVIMTWDHYLMDLEPLQIMCLLVRRTLYNLNSEL